MKRFEYFRKMFHQNAKKYLPVYKKMIFHLTDIVGLDAKSSTQMRIKEIGVP